MQQEVAEDEICSEYFEKKKEIQHNSNISSFLVTVFNMMIRSFVIARISSIGYNQESILNREIMKAIFISQFINTGVIILLTNANFTGTILSFIPINNSFNDFTSEWYRASGSSLVTTMLYGAFTPFIQFIVAFSTKNLLRIYDQGIFNFFNKNRKTTKKLSI